MTDIITELEDQLRMAKNLDLIPMSDAEARRWKARLGDFDLIVGHFGIKDLRPKGVLTPIYDASKVVHTSHREMMG